MHVWFLFEVLQWDFSTRFLIFSVRVTYNTGEGPLSVLFIPVLIA